MKKKRRKYGTGSVTPKGYIRINGEFEHRRIWKNHHGPIPRGMQVHHRNENKQDNRLSNFKLVGPLRHRRIHSGCRLYGGRWIKPCRKCGRPQDVKQHYYKRARHGISPWCKKCCIENSVYNKKLRLARQKK